uniref:Uncharacterized protein n=1 Tax=Lygus hesperus TaxID=30085 RepID=A0A0K8TCQ5_LYGHE
MCATAWVKMTVRALFVIAVVVQLQFSVEANCTTELSETDDADVTSSPGDDFQNESQDDNRNSTKRDDTALGTDKRKRSNQDGSGVGVIKESIITHDAEDKTTKTPSALQNNSWGISKEEAKTAILEEVSSGFEYQYNDLGIINDDRFDRELSSK